MSKEKTRKYIVTHPGVCLKGTKEEEKGAKVDLTEEKAAAMVNKVRLLGDYEAELSNGDSTKELEAMTAERDDTRKAYDISANTIATTTAERDELVKALEAMTAERDELVKALEAMTPKPAKPAKK